ncbi:ATP-binding protein [Zunongwangia sp.]|uniref:tetratricopeptide repeat-containing hybrid sensor histidine kinase/response regulator n=1 Tax=Zunongwangia sp. TaxID=1965325 RepID=UPI003AA7B329
MNYLRLKFLILFSCFVFSLNAQNLQDKKETIHKIKELLVQAETSVNSYQFDNAIKKLNTSLQFAKQINHKRYIALTSGIFSKLYYIRHDYKKAKTELERAIAIQREIKDHLGLAYSYLSLAKIYTADAKRSQAKEYLSLAEIYYKKYGGSDSKEKLAAVSVQKAVINIYDNKNLAQASKWLQEASKYIDINNYPYEFARLYYYYGKCELLQKHTDKAIIFLELSLKSGIKYDFNGVIRNAYKLLSTAYQDKNDISKSLYYLNLSYAELENIIKINKKTLVDNLNSKEGNNVLQSNIQELTEQMQEQERSLKVNKLTTILSVALITILSLLTLSLYKNNNLRARANNLLYKKNKELTVAKENAERASSAKAQFLSTITHELRTPLYAVTGLTHLLLEEDPKPSQKEHLKSLKFSGEYLLSLINNILDLNKLEANKVEINYTEFNLKKSISDVIISLKNSADNKKTTIDLDFDETIPEKLKGDPLKISQILINLIGNSIKFTKKGKIWVSVKNTSQNKEKATIFFEIKDNGKGISKEHQKNIFENFTQASSEINRKFGGTGLGLPIVKNLLNLLGSDIELESELNKGSRFSFTLDFDIVNTVPANTGITIDQESINLISGKSILVVEDNKINQMITKKIIEKKGAKTSVSDNGKKAIKMVKEQDFDLILMDIHMPGISGIEATKEIRKFNSNVPIIALTAVTLEDNLDEFYLNGFNDIIPKPYKTDEFFQKINKHIGKQK